MYIGLCTATLAHGFTAMLILSMYIYYTQAGLGHGQANVPAIKYMYVADMMLDLCAHTCTYMYIKCCQTHNIHLHVHVPTCIFCGALILM